MERYPILLEEQTKHGHSLFPCAIYNVEADRNNSEKIYYHWHKEIELLYVQKGQATLSIDRKASVISAGDFAFIPSNTVHMAYGEPDAEFQFIAIVFHPNLIRSFGNDSVQEKYLTPLCEWQFDCSYIIKNDPFYQNLVFDLVRHYQEKEAGYELSVKIHLLELCLSLYHYTQPFRHQKRETEDYRIALIKEMMLYLQEQYTETISLSEMADHFHVSKGHLCRFFKEMTNTTPMNYLNYYRINKSARLLRDTALEISDIAVQTGFNNISYYNRTFRKYMHMTPGDYRSNAIPFSQS